MESIIKNLYELVFPYLDFPEGDYIGACIRLRREIKKICHVEMRIPLLMLGRVAGMKFNPETPLIEICSKVQDYLINTCLKLDDSIEQTALITHWGLGVAPHVIQSEACNIISYDLQTPLELVISERGYDFVEKKMNNLYPGIDHDTIVYYIVTFFHILTIKEDKFLLPKTSRVLPPASDIIELYEILGVSYDKNYTDLDRKTIMELASVPLLKSNIFDKKYLSDMSMKVYNLFREGKLNLDVSWDDLCSNINTYCNN